MKIHSILIIALSLLVTLSSCVESRVDREAEEERLMHLSRQWAEVAATGDLDSTLTFWADNAVMMPPGTPLLRGKESIRKFLQSTSQIPGFEISWEPESAHISEDGSLAYMIERNRIAFNDSLGNLVVQHNKVTTVWQKNEDGAWKNVVDMWNEAPPQQ